MTQNIKFGDTDIQIPSFVFNKTLKLIFFIGGEKLPSKFILAGIFLVKNDPNSGIVTHSYWYSKSFI